VWPTLVKIGSFEIGTFGVMAALGFLAAYLVFRAEIKRLGLQLKLSSELLVSSIIGGLVGARINFALEYWDVLITDPVGILWSRYGFTWYGGVFGAALAGIIVLKVRKQKWGRYFDACAPAAALGYVFGRAGCQLAGDGDYGVPSNLPWAMSYPRGIVPTLERVHPAPIYEMIAYLAIFFVLWRLRRLEKPPGWLFGVFLMLTAIERFSVEFVRTNEQLWLELTEAQLVSVGVAIFGGALVVLSKARLARRAA
jgi:phosphatidylglycerol:prolipoprotein diacylglycerol transferase